MSEKKLSSWRQACFSIGKRIIHYKRKKLFVFWKTWKHGPKNSVDLHNIILLVIVIQSLAESNLPPCRKLLILINPFSGSGRSVRTFREKVEPMLCEADIQYKQITTGLPWSWYTVVPLLLLLLLLLLCLSHAFSWSRWAAPFAIQPSDCK